MVPLKFETRTLLSFAVDSNQLTIGFRIVGAMLVVLVSVFVCVPQIAHIIKLTTDVYGRRNIWESVTADMGWRRIVCQNISQQFHTFSLVFVVFAHALRKREIPERCSNQS